MNRLLFWMMSFVLAAFLGLMVFFILYLDASRRDIEASIAEGIPGFGSEVAGAVRAELERGAKSQVELATLRIQNSTLQNELALAREENQTHKKKVRDLQRLLDLRRAELEQSRKMIEELIVRTGSPGEEGDTVVLKDRESGPAADRGGLLREINLLFERANLSWVKIVECGGISDAGIETPSITVKDFGGSRTAVLRPDRLVIDREGDRVRLRNEGKGTFTPLGEEPKRLEANRLNLVFDAAYLDGVRHPELCRLFGMEPPAGVPGEDGGPPDSAANRELVALINRLLEKEKGKRFRFSSIGSVGESLLREVVFNEFDRSGSLKKSVEAKSCRLSLSTRDRYIVMHFEDGFIVEGRKRKSFYDNKYKIPFINIDPEAWKKAEFDFLVEE